MANDNEKKDSNSGDGDRINKLKLFNDSTKI